MDNRALLSGVAIGAALTLAFDPDRGARRRALLRDKMIRGSRLTADAADATLRDVQNRTRGIAAVARGRLQREEVDDARLLERVRAKLGRVCSHPHAIDVETRAGEVTLRGPIFAGEVKAVMATVASVRGVETVISELEPHDTSDGVPSLQGEGRRAGPSLDLLQSNWAPATRALVSVAALAAAGGAAMAYARR